MRARWEEVRASLLSSVTTLQAEQEFRAFRETSTAFTRFESPSALVASLNAPAGDLTEKDGIYRVLVTEAQAGGGQADLATAILWLGLWPGLDNIYRSHLRHFWPNPDDLVSALGASFTAVIARANISRIHRVAATLVWNTERSLIPELRRKWRDESVRADLPEDDLLAESRELVESFLARGVTENQEIVALRARLLAVVGDRDVDLVLSVILGDTQKEAGARFGLSHDVARKRYERALDRIRDSEGVVVPIRPRKVRLEGEGTTPTEGQGDRNRGAAPRNRG